MVTSPLPCETPECDSGLLAREPASSPLSHLAGWPPWFLCFILIIFVLGVLELTMSTRDIGTSPSSLDSDVCSLCFLGAEVLFLGSGEVPGFFFFVPTAWERSSLKDCIVETLARGVNLD